MNKIKKIILSILAGVDVTFYIFTPMIVITIWNNLINMGNFTSNFLYAIGFMSSLFRAIKIGWMK